ncbi:unnamed protein product [Bathycoccus prasinos]
MPAAKKKTNPPTSSSKGTTTEKVAEEKIASHLEMQKKFVSVGFAENKHTQERAYFNAYSGGAAATEEDEDAFSLEQFRKNFTIKVTENNESTHTLEFEMEGISAAFANAFRRIIISEVPSMAIERVYFRQNTSVIADEIFAHRLGLVPILADPNEFESFDKDTHTDLLNEKNTIVFKLHVKCQKERDASGNILPDSILHEKVYSRDLVWLPKGSELEDESQGATTTKRKKRKKKKIKTFSNFSTSQETKFGKEGIKTVHDDILLAKLVPGQEIELEAHCMKSIGADHAKFSPVGTCWYRLVPTVYFKKPIVGADAKVFMSECSDPIPNHKCFELKGSGEKAEVKIKSIRGCDLCLERIRELSGETGWDSKIAVLKKRDHYIFTIESVGARKPDVIFKEAVSILKSKCHSALGRLL